MSRTPARLSSTTGWKGALLRGELALKEKLFGCRMCGQCLLRKTSLVCPMTCPKGLRNGPCGGTLDGRCEVYPDRECVWVRIWDRRNDSGQNVPRPIHAPIDESLLDTSSFLSLLNGSDRRTRLPLPFLDLPRDRGQSEAATESGLEARLRSGMPAVTAELRSPRTPKGLERLRREIAALAPLVDALNTTSDHGGVERIPSLRIAEEVVGQGCEAIPHLCGRDVDAQGFLERLLEIQEAGVHNTLCLTGDWSAELPEGLADAQRSFFRVESAQMIYEARHLREKGASAFAELRDRRPPKLFVGGAINPFSTPRRAVIGRLAQKIASGVDFIQTQAVCDVPGFRDWLRSVEEHGLSRSVHILASIPVVGTPGGLRALGTLPGIHLPAGVEARFARSGDVASEGMALAREIIEELLAPPRVDGLHFLNFGVGAPAIAELVAHARELEGSAGRAGAASN